MEKFTTEIADKLKAFINSDDVKAVVAATKAADGDTGTFKMTITTEDVDRYREVILLGGWELDHYNNNPVVLWGHDHFTLPVGVTTNLYVEDGKLIAEGKFAPHEHAQEIRALYDLGIVRASSVGFIEKEREGNIITKAELIEWSFVSVPANPHALSLAMKSGRSIDELITKGFLTVKTISDDTRSEDETKEVVEEPATDEPTDTTERKFDTKTIVTVTDHLKAALGALEALQTEEPERTEEEEVVETTEVEKDLERFTAMKSLFQSVDTTLGEVLAELRKADSR
jgi:HK97 family phage prohead protease